MQKLITLTCTLLILIITGKAQETFPVNGVKNEVHNFYAFTNANIVVDPGNTINNGTLLVKDGKVEKAGKDIKIPENSVVYDLDGKFIYPSLIDIYSHYGIKKAKKDKKPVPRPQFLSEKKGAYHWNQAVKPEISSNALFHTDKKEAGKWRELGFGSVLTHQQDGIVRGTSSLVTLDDEKDNKVVVNGRVAAHYSFDKGVSGQNYPSSLMGSIALLRQTYYDAEWYGNQGKKKEYNISLQAFNEIQDLPQIFEVKDKYSILRAEKLAKEFGVNYIFKGSGDEYQRLNEIKSTGKSVIIPLDFPKAYDVEDPFDAMLVTLSDMKHWEMAPSNAAMLADTGITFAITAAGLKNKEKEFWPNIRKAIDRGLSSKKALKALTTTPASMLKADSLLGTLEKGKIANFIITSDSLFSKDRIIHENWVNGNRFVISPMDIIDIRGQYDLNASGDHYKLMIKGKPEKPEGKVSYTIESKEEEDGKTDTATVKAKIELNGNLISLIFKSHPDEKESIIRLSGSISDHRSGIWTGKGQLPNGKWLEWSAIKTEKFKQENKTDSAARVMQDKTGEVTYPFIAYGWKEKPKQETVLYKNATVWTNTEQGIIEKGKVFIQEGEIKAVGNSIDPELLPDTIKEVDLEGKHLTAGIIDEHSHIAITRGVNEGSQASTAEVRIGDVVNPDDVNIYRQLSGGVTASQLLHGSANPIGGQSALIKMRWGSTPEGMKIDSADGFIKFALGENVKQSNWGDYNRERFPQTRMGVEQVFYDHFIRAKEYNEQWSIYNSSEKGKKGNFFSRLFGKKKDQENFPPRVDIEMEALSEILNKERFITCHSYVQSEVNMLMHVADSMNFRINTFTHILEGYKIADKLAAHGAAGSTFSDWWAYKFEVNDAIPYNGAIMHNQGVLTGFNSDDAEMGRRLNQEAAKAIKYGGVSEEEALKFVTLNPAKMLHLEDKMGSLKSGNDADFVIWTDHPLSVYSKAWKTYVDGICYFDLKRDKKMRKEMEEERARLIQKMLIAKEKGAPTQKPKPKDHKLYHCDTLEDEN